MLDLEKLMKLHDAATPGPWKSHPMGTNETFHLRISKYYPETEWVKNTAFVFHKSCISSYADAEYICAACNAVPELVSRIKHLEAQLYEAVGYIISNESQSMIDCRICFFERYCERKKDQWKPDYDMCQKAILSCVAADVRKNDA